MAIPRDLEQITGVKIRRIEVDREQRLFAHCSWAAVAVFAICSKIARLAEARMMPVSHSRSLLSDSGKTTNSTGWLMRYQS